MMITPTSENKKYGIIFECEVFSGFFLGYLGVRGVFGGVG
jgi:hypothetical protein